MTGKVDRMNLIEQKAKAVFKESLKIIALTIILTSILGFLGQKSYDYLSPRGRQELKMEKHNPESVDQEDFFIKLLPTSKNRSFRQAFYPGNILLTGLSDLVMAGLFVAIYRQVFEDNKPSLGDVFIFFKKHPVRNLLISLVLTVLRLFLYYSLLIPGYYFSLVIFFYPLVLYFYLDKETLSPVEFCKTTLALSKGRKMLVFTKQFKYGVLFIGLALGLGFILLVLSLGGQGPLYSLFYKLVSSFVFLGILAAGIWLYMATIEVFEEIKLDQETLEPGDD